MGGEPIVQHKESKVGSQAQTQGFSKRFKHPLLAPCLCVLLAFLFFLFLLLLTCLSEVDYVHLCYP